MPKNQAIAASSPTAPARGHPSALPGHERRQRVQAAETCLAVLKALARLGGRASLTVIGRETNESPAKVHRYLASLMAEGLVVQDPGSSQYVLAAETIHIGLAAMRQSDPVRMGESALLHLREQFEVVCFIAVMGNRGPTIVRFEEPSVPVTVNARAGSVLSVLWSATGRVFLAYAQDGALVTMLAAQELEQAPAQRRAQLDAEDPLGALVRQVRRHGCASVHGAYLQGIDAVAAPLLDYTGHVAGVLCALGAEREFDPDPHGPIALALRAEAARISTSMGYQPPEHAAAPPQGA